MKARQIRKPADSVSAIVREQKGKAAEKAAESFNTSPPPRVVAMECASFVRGFVGFRDLNELRKSRAADDRL